jgi:hypothetical protein
VFRCNCGRYTNFGTTCYFCSKDIETLKPRDKDVDLFYLVEKQDWDAVRKFQEEELG